jgi:hypothetical protein
MAPMTYDGQRSRYYSVILEQTKIRNQSRSMILTPQTYHSCWLCSYLAGSYETEDLFSIRNTEIVKFNKKSNCSTTHCVIIYNTFLQLYNWLTCVRKFVSIFIRMHANYMIYIQKITRCTFKPMSSLRQSRTISFGYTKTSFLRWPFEKFVVWQQCVAVMEREAGPLCQVVVVEVT